GVFAEGAGGGAQETSERAGQERLDASVRREGIGVYGVGWKSAGGGVFPTDDGGRLPAASLPPPACFCEIALAIRLRQFRAEGANHDAFSGPLIAEAVKPGAVSVFCRHCCLLSGRHT